MRRRAVGCAGELRRQPSTGSAYRRSSAAGRAHRISRSRGARGRRPPRPRPSRGGGACRGTARSGAPRRRRPPRSGGCSGASGRRHVPGRAGGVAPARAPPERAPGVARPMLSKWATSPTHPQARAWLLHGAGTRAVYASGVASETPLRRGAMQPARRGRPGAVVQTRLAAAGRSDLASRGGCGPLHDRSSRARGPTRAPRAFSTPPRAARPRPRRRRAARAPARASRCRARPTPGSPRCAPRRSR